MLKAMIKKIGRKLYNWTVDEKRIGWTRGVYHFLLKIAGTRGAHVIDKKKREYYYARVRQEGKEARIQNSLQFTGEKPLEQFEPYVSVIVPNYNHNQFLKERLETIYNQTYQNFEVVLLDDASEDDSLNTLREFCQKYPERTKLIVNEKNSGNVFVQWAKGLEHATGDIIWIAESDDFCELNFLETLIPYFCYQSVRIAFAQSFFIKDGMQIWSTQEYLSDLQEVDWENSFVVSASDMVKHGFAEHNIIANVSSTLIRNYEGISERLLELSKGMKLSGDWIFYLDLIRGGTIAYSTDTINYYRIHEKSTSLKVQETEAYYREFEAVSCYVAENYRIKYETFEKIFLNLQQRYEERGRERAFILEECYSLEKISACMQKRKPNLAMACYALKSGGGETYPIYLANEMRRRGYNIALINFRIEPTQIENRNMVDSRVPLIELEDLGDTRDIIQRLDLDLIHSHHANVDEILAMVKNGTGCSFSHVVTLHGLYEMIPVDRSRQIMEEVCRECSKFIYIAEKNKAVFIDNGYYQAENFIKIINGLPRTPIVKLSRAQVGVEEDDFVITLASRAIPDKGWEQAICAVEEIVRSYSDKIVLFLLGEGEERRRLLSKESKNIRMPGNSECVRSYFALSDLTILPTVYKGESLPLVVIESLLVGTPVISTDVGEIRSQLVDENGDYAGEFIPVRQGKAGVPDMVEILIKYMKQPKLLQELQRRTKSAVKKFDFDKIVDRHMDLYQEICAKADWTNRGLEDDSTKKLDEKL